MEVSSQAQVLVSLHRKTEIYTFHKWTEQWNGGGSVNVCEWGEGEIAKKLLQELDIFLALMLCHSTPISATKNMSCSADW